MQKSISLSKRNMYLQQSIRFTLTLQQIYQTWMHHTLRRTPMQSQQKRKSDLHHPQTHKFIIRKICTSDYIVDIYQCKQFHLHLIRGLSAISSFFWESCSCDAKYIKAPVQTMMCTNQTRLYYLAAHWQYGDMLQKQCNLLDFLLL